jgi:hypothetical protein
MFLPRTGNGTIHNYTCFPSCCGSLSPHPNPPPSFRSRYKKAPSFFSLHLGVKAEVFQAKKGHAAETDCHHIILEDWAK